MVTPFLSSQRLTGADEVGVVEREDLLLGFDDGDPRPEFGEGDAEFEADVACADDHEFLRYGVERQGFG